MSQVVIALKKRGLEPPHKLCYIWTDFVSCSCFMLQQPFRWEIIQSFWEGGRPLALYGGLDNPLEIIIMDLVIMVMRAWIYLLLPLYLKNLQFPWLLMKMLWTILLKIPHNVTEVMLVLMVLLLTLKIVFNFIILVFNFRMIYIFFQF